MEASPEFFEKEPEHKRIAPGWGNSKKAKKLSAKLLREVFGRDSEIPEMLISMGYLCPVVIEELFCPKHLEPLMPPAISEVGDLFDQLILKLELEIVCDNRDLAILKRALAVCQKFT